MTLGEKTGLTGADLLAFVAKQQEFHAQEQAKEREERAKEREERAKKAEHEEKLAQIKAEQEEKLVRLKAEQEENMVRVKTEEQAKLSRAKAEEEERIAAVKMNEVQRKAEEEERMAKMKADDETRTAEFRAQENAMMAQRKSDQDRRKAEEEEVKRRAKIAEEKEKMSLRLEAEERKRIQEQETIKMKIADENKKREQEVEMMKLKIEFERERARAEMDVLEKKGEVGVTDSREMRGNGNAKAPRLPNFIDGKDDLDAYLLRFERFAQIRSWHRDDWAVNLSALLTGEALAVYTRMAADEAMDYSRVKEALLKRYRLTEDGFRSKFRDNDPMSGESPGQFITRLKNYLDRWMEMAHVDREFEGLYNLMVKEQFVKKCSNDLSVYLKEKAFESLEEMAEQAERFLIAHNKEMATGKDRNRPMMKPGPVNPVQRVTRECFNCGNKGHVKSECRGKGGGRQVRCTKCSRYGHETPDCRIPRGVIGFLSTRRRPAYKMERNIEVTQELNAKEPPVGQEEDLVPSHQEQKIEVKEDRTIDEKMQAIYTKVNGSLVSTLRDTGCSTICVNSNLVDPDQLTGETKTFTFLDGKPQHAKVARIDVDTPYLKKTAVEAVCIDNPTFDLVLGEVDDVRCRCNPDPDWKIESIGAVTTRAQETKRKKQLSPLKVYVQDEEISVTPEIVIGLQQEDETLQKVRDKELDVKRTRGKGSSWYTVKHKILHRVYQQENSDNMIEQVVVPMGLRTQVMGLAHESMMGGHLGVKKTMDKIQASFYWPGIHGDITRYCRSCDVCQKTLSKGRVTKVPLMKMPLIETPFKRVAVDIVGPIHPMTDRHNRYILTMVDYATRYPEAVPLKSVTTIEVAEAMVDMFSRLGVPEEILSDQGAQFMSEVMQEVSRMLSVKRLVSTPYHPICNGLCEKFNGTLKRMLKRLCESKPKDWDRYVNAALFAYREAPQESTGFAPFELLYGRTVRGPVQILKQLWTEEIKQPGVKSSYEYIVDLRERMEEGIKLAHESLQQAQRRYKKYYDRKSKQRKFQEGDEVLMMLPTDANKLLMQWKGPFKIDKKVGTNDFRIKIGEKSKVYHANMLKKYTTREEKITANVIEVVSAAVVESSDSTEDDVVNDEQLLELNYLKGKETYRDVKVAETLDEQKRRDVMNKIEGYQDIFSEAPGKTSLEEHHIILTSNTPVRTKPYAIPYNCRESLKKDIEEMEKLGIIRKAESPYASPVVIVRKPDGSNRICIDYRKLNKVTVFDGEPTPNADDIFAEVGKDKYYSTLDMTKGYYQIKMADEDIMKTGFVTPDGCYVFQRMPFGLVNSAASYNRMMRKMLSGLNCVEAYIDDIMVHTETWEEHIKVLGELFRRIKCANLTVRPTKCKFGYTKVDFLGHHVGEGEIGLHENNVEKIKAAKPPQTKKEVRSFLGLTGYYRNYIPNYAAIATPLTDLTKKGSPNKVEWGDSQQKAFESLKCHLMNRPILRLPDMTKDFILRTDASDQGVGAVLLQECCNQLFPISFASKKFADREKRYSTMEKECLALVWAVKKFQVYLYGRTFTLQTDHQPLVYLDKCKVENARIMRWALFLTSYPMHIEAIKGVENVGADFMSRAKY